MKCELPANSFQTAATDVSTGAELKSDGLGSPVVQVVPNIAKMALQF